MKMVISSVAVLALLGISLQGITAIPSSSNNPVANEKNFQPGKTFRDCAGCPEMVVIPGGSFEMGTPATELVIPPSKVPRISCASVDSPPGNLTSRAVNGLHSRRPPSEIRDRDASGTGAPP